MADDPRKPDPADIAVPPAKEDAETTATRRELKQTSISEKETNVPEPSSQDSSNASENEAEQPDAAPARRKTPELIMKDLPHDELIEHVSSPKKKRAHDQLDEPKADDESGAITGGASADLNGSSTLSRTDRSEPEKKRARDEHGDDEVHDEPCHL